MRILAIFLVALMVAACGGSETLDAEEYFTAVEQTLGDYQDERDALTVGYLDDLETEIAALQRSVGDADQAAAQALTDQAVELTKAKTAKLFASIGDALARLDADLEDAVPPSDLEPLHVEMRRSVRLAADGVPGLIDAVGQANGFDALDNAIAGSVFTDAQPRFDSACVRLEEEATARDMTIHLRCGA
jgi:hypothetical protein